MHYDNRGDIEYYYPQYLIDDSRIPARCSLATSTPGSKLGARLRTLLCGSVPSTLRVFVLESHLPAPIPDSQCWNMRMRVPHTAQSHWHAELTQESNNLVAEKFTSAIHPSKSHNSLEQLADIAVGKPGPLSRFHIHSSEDSRSLAVPCGVRWCGELEHSWSRQRDADAMWNYCFSYILISRMTILRTFLIEAGYL